MATSEIVEFIGDWTGPVVATSVHAGHELRPEIAEPMVLDEAERFREEDPFTDRIAAVVPDRVLTTSRSRFEADLNRPRREAIYRTPDDCWGLERVARRRAVRTSCSRAASRRTTRSSTRSRRGSTPWPSAARSSCSTCTPTTIGATAPTQPPAPAHENPEVNVGTGSVDHDLFGPLVERFMGDLRRRDPGLRTARRPGERRVRGAQPRLVGARPLSAGRVACWPWSSRRPSWTSGPASSTEPRSACARMALAAALPGLREELERLR